MTLRKEAEFVLERLETAYDEGRLRDWLDEAVEVETIKDHGYYKGCCVIVTYGGPTVCLYTTTGCIEFKWGDDFARVPISDEIRDAIDEIVENFT